MGLFVILEEDSKEPAAVVRRHQDVDAWLDAHYGSTWRPTPFGRYEVYAKDGSVMTTFTATYHTIWRP